MESQDRSFDSRVGSLHDGGRDLNGSLMDLAMRQYGVVSSAQLTDLGFAGHRIQSMLRSSRLLRVHRGVYSVGRYVDSELAWLMAAVLLSGPGAALARSTAASHWGFAPSGRLIETVRPYNRYPLRNVSGLQIGDRRVLVHRSRFLPEGEITTHRGVPVTTVPRTLLDKAGETSFSELAKLFYEADRLKILDTSNLDRVLDRGRGWKGLAKLKRLAELRHEDDKKTKSDMEIDFLKLCRKNGIERPEVNVPLLGYEVDCLWRARRVVVELDSYGFHHQRSTFESDRERDIVLRQNDYEVLRVTHRNLELKPGWVVATLRQVFDKADRRT